MAARTLHCPLTAMPEPAYMHGYSPSVLASHQWRTAANSAEYILPYLGPDLHLLDVGSGAGTITCDFAGLVRKVTALELSEEAINVTKAEAARRGVTLDYAVGNVHELPFEDNTFDVVHAHQVLQHVRDPVQAMRELRRVVKDGGVVGVRDSDYPAFTWYPADPKLEEWRELYLKIARSSGFQPDAGRKLLDWALQANFSEIDPGANVWCFATPEGRAYWGGMWEKRILQSQIADDAKAQGVSQDELQAISEAWGRWKNAANGWYMVPHGHILARK